MVEREERRGPTEARDDYGKRVLLTRYGLAYGEEEFVPFDEMDGAQPAPQPLWNPATNLFEVVARRGGPDLVLKNLSLRTADRLGEAITRALRKRRA